MVVLGGSGYVGSNICREAVSRGHTVTSVNVRGKPDAFAGEAWAAKVTWVKASVFEPESWQDTVDDKTVVVSSIGVLGNAATMYVQDARLWWTRYWCTG